MTLLVDRLLQRLPFAVLGSVCLTASGVTIGVVG